MVCYYASWSARRPGLGRFSPEDVDATVRNGSSFLHIYKFTSGVIRIVICSLPFFLNIKKSATESADQVFLFVVEIQFLSLKRKIGSKLKCTYMAAAAERYISTIESFMNYVMYEEIVNVLTQLDNENFAYQI